MDPSEFVTISQEIAEAGGDQGIVTSALSRMTDAFTELFATSQDLKKTNEGLVERNNKLQEYNMALFLQHGAQIKESTGTPEEKEKSRAETITFDDLFKKEEK